MEKFFTGKSVEEAAELAAKIAARNAENAGSEE